MKRNPGPLRHGHSAGGVVTSTYAIWRAMVSRCRNPKNPAYARYGGRGISVCQSWLKFDNFLADMGTRPPGLTLDRIDNNSGYRPDNCRWTDRQTQTANSRTARLDHDKAAEIRAASGVTELQLAERYGVSVHCIRDVRQGRTWAPRKDVPRP